MSYKISAGSSAPLGAQAVKEGVNFALFSENATACTLCIFEQEREIRLPMVRSGDIWHLFVHQLKAGTHYGFRLQGAVDEAKGHLFNPQKLLLDPYARQIVGKPDVSTAEKRAVFVWDNPLDNGAFAPKSVVVKNDAFDWQGVEKPNHSWSESIIYELHVKGFSRLNPAIPKALRGTYAGLAHPASIAHLKRLGVTCVELQPISYKADEVHLQKIGLSNYWGYSVLGHNAVETSLAADPENALDEFKQMVKALHQADIEVILDVVYNHTVEGGKTDMCLSLRGIDNAAYYWLNDEGDYHNWTGCGNALNLSHPRVCQWAIESLEYWATECQIDGFRFDLASTLGRTPDFSVYAPFFDKLRQSERLKSVKLIAEPWDLGHDGYQAGGFPAHFAEWNDQYRSDMRDFFLQESGDLGTFARRLAGSDDRYGYYLPTKSINYFASHDGFNLQDLVSYNQKHNWANGEENRDGDNHNHSNNHGVEGATDNALVNLLRDQTACAMLATLFLSHGVPMLLAGDELGHSQQGNNNSYCQDNEMTWLDWQNADQKRIQWVADWIALRKQIALLGKNHWWTDNDIEWLNTKGKPMQLNDWHDMQSKAMQILLQDRYLILLNGKKAGQTFLPPQGKWSFELGEKGVTFTSDKRGVNIQMEQMGVCVLLRK